MLAATDAGMTTLTDELAKRGYTFGEWLEMRKAEIDEAEKAGVPLFHSNMSRSPEQPQQQTQPEAPDADPIEEEQD